MHQPSRHRHCLKSNGHDSPPSGAGPDELAAVTVGGFMKRGIVMIVCLFLVFNLAAFKEKDNKKKFKITLGLGANSIFERGDVDQYAAGINEFPVTPGRQPSCFSFAGAYHFSHQLSLELIYDHTSGGKVDKTNPANGDIVYAYTFRQWMLTLNGDYLLFKRGQVNFHLLGGAGLNEQYHFFDGTYTTRQEQTVMLPVPDKFLFPSVNIGGGIVFNIDYRAGLKLDARYVKVFADVNHIDSVIISFRFFVFLHWDGEYLY